MMSGLDGSPGWRVARFLAVVAVTALLAKAGLDAAAVLAAIVLVTGLILLVWGAVALIRAIPG